ncbi:MAG: hypothetical protein LBS72_09655 [Oscillospiraceae bacterium]|jgi:hypothetical protein|nr:hypothetical protein [Oscillospiraceae bacterium]
MKQPRIPALLLMLALMVTLLAAPALAEVPTNTSPLLVVQNNKVITDTNAIDITKDIYIGQYADGLPNGFGIYFAPAADGNRLWFGNFLDGDVDGEAVLIGKDGTRTEGRYRGGKLLDGYVASKLKVNSLNIQRSANGSVMIWEVNEGKRTGVYADVLPDGFVRVAHMQDGIVTGYGMSYNPSLDLLYYGNFKEAMYHDVDAYIVMKGVLYECIYKNNRLVEQVTIK